MKRKLLLTLFLIVLVVLPLIFVLNATFTVKEDFVFLTNARFTLGADIDFYETEVNSTHLWMDKSYTSKYYTRYCIYVYSPSNVNLTVNTWFATANSSGSLTITAPISTNINLGFYSPNLISASVSEAVTSAWYSGNQTLTMTVNTDTSATFIISATVTETEEANITPENVNVIITDMEGCGAWVFSEEEYYTFQAQYWDGNGYAELDTMKLNFTDGLRTIIPVYEQSTSEWSLESGGDVVNLKAGSVTVLGPNTIRVTFEIYFENTILDALNVDIFMWCNDTNGASDGWDEVQTDYFNIYNLGGASEITSSGNAGRITGGDVFDLYAYNNSWVEATTHFRNLQHIKLLPEIFHEFNTSDVRVDNFLEWKVQIDYCIDDTWLTGWSVTLKPINARGGGTQRFITINVTWANRGTDVLTDQIRLYHTGVASQLNTTWRIWVDLWFNKINASSTVGGRVNAYYYAMYDSSPAWLRWLTGSNWGIDETWPKQSMFFDQILDADGNVAYTKQIEMVRVTSRLSVLASIGGVNIPSQISDFDIFDLTIGSEPFSGIQTPVFDETKVVVMPQGGFLGALWTALVNLGTAISEAFGPVILGFWNAFVGFMDTIFTWAGWPNGFSQIGAWIISLAEWIGNSVNYLISLLTSAFLFISAIIAKLLNTLSIIITQWVTMIQNIFSMLGGGLGTGIDIWESLNLNTWVIILAILYPIFLFGIWEEKGVDAMLNHIQMVINILAWLGRIFLTVIQVFISIVMAIIESIPIVE